VVVAVVVPVQVKEVELLSVVFPEAVVQLVAVEADNEVIRLGHYVIIS